MTWFVFTSGWSESRSDSFIFLPQTKHLKHPERRCCFSPLGCSVLTRAAQGTGCPPSLQNSSLHQCHHTKIQFAGKLRSKCSTTSLTHRQQAFHLSKKNTLKIFKNNNKKKRLNHAKSCKCLPQVLLRWCDRVPALSLGGTATRLFTPSFSASLADSAPAVWLYPYPGTALNKTVPTP